MLNSNLGKNGNIFLSCLFCEEELGRVFMVSIVSLRFLSDFRFL